MGKLNFAALRVRQTAIAQIANGKTRRTPAWLNITSEIPPAAVLTRNTVIPHTLERQRRVTDPETGVVTTVIQSYGKRRHKNTPRKLVYEEDGLRQRVIQRQLWLLQNVPDISEDRAYDIARNEFYSARLKEELERSVAHEEALATGAYFGPRMLEVGLQLEDKAFERWKEWSQQELMLQEARLAAFAGDPGLGDDDVKTLETDATLDQTAAMDATKKEEAPKKKDTLASLFGV
ncbi:37S ribosomal protein Rsm25 [Ascosphaera apis ARSEF 7405]|uniref:Small ribosomal subunit protein mS23 n=1 Tax=Ascosphaera apis ARSEF 7405 TaxID=392613 RepID=A0A168CAX2_9EURO|nr:37S ribosomal protein Rsm25 [Ascosphaera apis ARSEF 7405]